MKVKLISVLSIALFITACSNQESYEQGSFQTKSNNPESDIRSYEEALAIAQASIPMLEQTSSNTRSGHIQRKIDLNDKKVFKLDEKEKTRAYSNINDTLIYVFNFEDNAGFALVSASKNTDGLLAITEQGYCDPDTPSEIEGLEMFKAMAKEYVRRATVEIPRGPNDPIIETRDSITYSYSTVGPYVNVRWGQLHPEGEYCPNGKSGCTNTAMAQIMAYYNYPTSIDLTYTGADINTQSLNWSSMKAHNTGHVLSACSTPEYHKAIGRLMRQLGELNHSEYKTTPKVATSTHSQVYAIPTFTSLGYTCGNWNTYAGFFARAQLNNAHLFLIRGTCDEGGHAWVLDGYKTVTITIREMARTATSGWFFTGQVSVENDHYMHFNWGWYGDSNGYFAEGVYDTTQAQYYDAVTTDSVHNFTTGIKLLNVYH
jgi:hypothetical protein